MTNPSRRNFRFFASLAIAFSFSALLPALARGEEPALDLFSPPAAELSAEQKQLSEAETWLASKAPKDRQRGFREFKRLADAGVEKAQLKVSEAYFAGLGVPKDPGAAWGWYEKAAAQGSARALNFLALRFRNGCGVKKDKAKAEDYLKRARAYASPEDLLEMEAAPESCAQFGKK